MPRRCWTRRGIWRTIENGPGDERSPAVKFIKFLWKDDQSNVGNCPSISIGRAKGRDGYIINGLPVDEETRSGIPHAGKGEAAVFVPANVIDRIRDLA